MFTDLVTRNPVDPQLNPQARAIVEAAVRAGGLPAEIQAKRQAFDALFIELGGSPEPVYQVENLTVPGTEDAIPIRVYRPQTGKLPDGRQIRCL